MLVPELIFIKLLKYLLQLNYNLYSSDFFMLLPVFFTLFDFLKVIFAIISYSHSRRLSRGQHSIYTKQCLLKREDYHNDLHVSYHDQLVEGFGEDEAKQGQLPDCSWEAGRADYFQSTHAPSSYDKYIICPAPQQEIFEREKTVNNTTALYSIITSTYCEGFLVRADSLDSRGDIPGQMNICANTAEELPVYLL